MTIGEKIYSLRKKHNLSQEELANELNVSRQTISKWELGESCPDFDKIVPLCELFDISTEELLRDKKIEEKNTNTTNVNNNVDILKAILICVSIFFYFMAVISTIVLSEVAHLNDGLTAAAFLTLSAIGTIILIFTLLTRKSKKQQIIEQKEEIQKEEKNPILKSVLSIFSLVTTCIYLLVSFITMAWHITWIIWIIYAIGVEIIKLIFSLKEGKQNEE